MNAKTPSPISMAAVLQEVAGSLEQVSMEFGITIDGHVVYTIEVDEAAEAVVVHLSGGQTVRLHPTVQS